MVNAGTAQEQSYSYDGYGVMLGDGASAGGAESTASTNYLYAGEQFDTSASMYYNRARYYNQSNGTFNRVYPFSGNLQDPQSLHKYAYCHNNPVNATDPSGLMGALLLNIAFPLATSIKLREAEGVSKAAVFNKIVAVTMLAIIGITHALLLGNGLVDVFHGIQRLQDIQDIQDLIDAARVNGLTQLALKKMTKRLRGTKHLYLHYSYSRYWRSFLATGLLGARIHWGTYKEGSYGTKRVYLTGWHAKWRLALPNPEPPNSIYIVYPKKGFEPTSSGPVGPKIDESGVLMGGGGYEYIFGIGSGGPGTVFGPIPLRKGEFIWGS